MTIEQTITRIRILLSFGLSVEEIHDRVKDSGINEGDFFLAFKAAKRMNEN